MFSYKIIAHTLTQIEIHYYRWCVLLSCIAHNSNNAPFKSERPTEKEREKESTTTTTHTATDTFY